MTTPEPRSTVWPIYVVGAVCLAISIGLVGMFAIVDPTELASPFGAVAVGAPFAAALAALHAGRDARRRVVVDGEPVPPRARRRAVASPPPRLGDDPFRDPPGAPPIVVERPAVAAAPIVPGDPRDRPKLLT